MNDSKKSKRIKLDSPEAIRKAIALAEDFGPGTENLSMEVDETLYGKKPDVIIEKGFMHPDPEVPHTIEKMTFEEALKQTNEENHELLQKLADMGPVMTVTMTAESREKIGDTYIMRGVKIESFNVGEKTYMWPPHLSYTVRFDLNRIEDAENEPDDYRK